MRTALKVGTPCRTGQKLALSKAGRIRPAKVGDKVIGVSTTRLRRGAVAVCASMDRWRSLSELDPSLAAVCASYLRDDLISPTLFPK